MARSVGRPRGADSQQTRKRILDAAIKVYAEKGPEGASVRNIADAAGENTGLVYYYFSDKEELFQSALVESAMRAMGGVLAAEARTAGSATERLEALYREYLRLIDEEPDVAMLALRALLYFVSEKEQPLGGIMFDRVKAVQNLVRAGQQEGGFTGVNPTAFGYAFISLAYSYLIAKLAKTILPEDALPDVESKDFLKIMKQVAGALEAESGD
ncbi:MAG: TetR/AcrR family transcriptional regulator [Actinobacteria bacterium]|nr:TetR/AcrR family transcriptional regulator [Actinomycetota bacterium]MBU1944010.1 TetR/AcrR family transcriptional regulator [Actinomycetota bacterium]MBU2688506.1 TetR/AcrR family transcriptional regulator [Actinomycetota bacterium]